MPSSAEKFLIDAGALNAKHSGRSLYAHLTGTRDILTDWGCRPEVCLAGLFHSVYGTRQYRNVLISSVKRAEVVNVIGTEAEHIAHLFSILRMPHAIFEILATGQAYCVPYGQFLSVTDEQCNDLIWIEWANLKEQKRSDKFVADLRRFKENNDQVIDHAIMAAPR